MVVARCTEGHLEHNVPRVSYQSAYHTGHTTKTTLLKVHNIVDVHNEMSMIASIMLGLSPIVNHTTVLHFLEIYPGI